MLGRVVSRVAGSHRGFGQGRTVGTGGLPGSAAVGMNSLPWTVVMTAIATIGSLSAVKASRARVLWSFVEVRRWFPEAPARLGSLRVFADEADDLN